MFPWVPKLDPVTMFLIVNRQVGTDPTAAGAVTGKEADAILAAYYAAEVAFKTIKAGNTNTQVTTC